MLRKDIKKAAAPASTADPAEIARFDKLAEDWWKPDGAFKVVHAFNAVRVAYLREQIPKLLGVSSLSGYTLTDIGCGAGIVTEPLSHLGATTLGLDAAERNVMVASHHAKQTGAPVTYRHGLPEELVDEGQTFDIVLSLEVVEHVADLSTFLDALAALVKPGGLLVIGTLNRTSVSYVKAIIGAEYVLGWLPRGTHDWRKFVTPDELDDHLKPKKFAVVENCGVELNPLTFRWGLSNSKNTNYIQIHRRAAG
jgi:2-polyprenyl-6-hydroxyphenyl methylase / 3-demethylubiquinone-9 3-methyltransferase